MTTNNISVDVITKGATFTFTGEHGAAALAAVRAHQEIQGPDSEDLSDLVIPYSAVTYVEWTLSQTDETVEDANCKVQTPEPEVASIVLRNTDIEPLMAVTITLSDTSINGTYSGVTFTNGVATIASDTIAPGASMTIVGLPDDIEVSVRVGSGVTSETNLTPCTIELANPSI